MIGINDPASPKSGPKVRVCTWGAGKELSSNHDAFFQIDDEGNTHCWHMHADGTECRIIK